MAILVEWVKQPDTHKCLVTSSRPYGIGIGILILLPKVGGEKRNKELLQKPPFSRKLSERLLSLIFHGGRTFRLEI